MAKSRPESHADVIGNLIESVFSRWDRVNGEHQKTIWQRLRSLLVKNPLELSPTGFIKPTGGNLRRISGILTILDKTIADPEYLKKISIVVSAYDLTQDANLKYYKGLISNFADRPAYRALRDLEVDRVLNAVVQAPFREALYNPIKAVLTQYTTSGGDYLDLVDKLSSSLLDQIDAGGDVVKYGYLKNYFWRKRITRDALFGYNRSYNETVANLSGMNWFYYAGGLVADSRQFCVERHQKYWHRREIESWALIPKKRWPEKMPDTNSTTIFQYLGGWNCRHSLIPVTLDRVPQKDVDRAIRKGFMSRAELITGP